jgi:DNA-binding transcriptional regulator PaaX
MACWKRFALRDTPWDEKWHLIHIALNTTTKKSDLNEKLQQLGYVQINVSTWLSPYLQTDAIKTMLTELEITADITSMHGDFDTSVGIQAYMKDIYELDSLESQYTEFNRIYQPLHMQIKEDPAIIADGKALPLLHKLGFAYFGIASLDPMLPRTLLPNWPGDSSALLMRDLRNTLESAAWDYLKSIVKKECKNN